MHLSTPIEQVPRIGPQYQKRLKKLGVENVEQLIFYFPHRYEDFSEITPIGQAEPDKTVCLQGQIADIKNIRTFRKRMTITEAKIKDQSGEIKVVWFNQPYLISSLKKDETILLAGKVVLKNSKKYVSSPSYEKTPTSNQVDLTHTGRIIPVYPETEGMSSRWLRFIIKPLLEKMRPKIPETLPEKEIMEKYRLLPIQEAIWQIHFPDSLSKADQAKKRFVFEELFNLSLIILSEKIKLGREKAAALPIKLELIQKFVKSLPFQLTDDQKKAVWQILKDTEKTRPMNRLLNGDVGSGKTMVALIAALNAISETNKQAAFMAPTEILAQQHFKTLRTFLKGYKIKIGLMTGRESRLGNKKIKRQEMLDKIGQNKCQILIGTHALIEEKVKFSNLALIVIDEQHRFGIEQRARLCRRPGQIPHLLSMSATPIPRTLALTVYGDLDLTLIKEMPRGRKKIITRIIPPGQRQSAYQFIRQQIKSGRQAFVVCPRIEPSNKNKEAENGILVRQITDRRQTAWLEVKAVKEEFEKLKKDIFPDLKTGMLHGKMKTSEKEKVLKDFKNKKIDLLVSTSVIEVGIDFPNATIMMIEGADKFGLAQLHQFRGRVGRGKEQAYCLLFSEFANNPRLRAMVKTDDGFELAEKDLKLRGPGDLVGQRQWGIPDFVMASLKDSQLIEQTREAAKEILRQDPGLTKHPRLRKKIAAFQKRVHLE